MAHTRQVDGSSPSLAIGGDFDRLFFLVTRLLLHFRRILLLSFAFAGVFFSYSSFCFSQSLAFGFGFGIPFGSYIEKDVSHEFRVQNEAGYYPILRDLKNGMGSAHFNVSFLLDADFLSFLDSLEIRFDGSRFLWNEAVVGYTSCEGGELERTQPGDFRVEYVPLKKADCIDYSRYSRYRSLKREDLGSLWFFSLSGGVRYHVVDTGGFIFFLGTHVGGVMSLFRGSSSFGVIGDLMAGISFALGEVVILEFASIFRYLITGAPGNKQLRMNIESRTGGNILTSMFEGFGFVDFQLSLRFVIF